MKIIRSLTHNFIFVFCMVFPLANFAQEQVTIKGKQTITTYNKLNVEQKIGNALINFMTALGLSEKSPDFEYVDELTNTHHFKATYTANRMDMEVIQVKQRVDIDNSDPREGPVFMLKDTTKAAIVFQLGSGGANMTMDLYLIDEKEIEGRIIQERIPMTSVAVPKKETYTIPENVIKLMEVGGVAGKSWKGHPTTRYKYKNNYKLKARIDSVSGIMRVDNLDVSLASSIPGTNVMSQFYDNVVAGGYDLGGSDEGGALSLIGFLLPQGMPVRLEEVLEVHYVAVQYDAFSLPLYSTTTNTQIFSIEVSDSASVSDTASRSSDENTEEDVPNEEEPEKESADCDCSCEKYKELMALSKKKKKDIDPSKMPQIDMSCMQKCAMQWANCRN